MIYMTTMMMKRKMTMMMTMMMMMMKHLVETNRSAANKIIKAQVNRSMSVR